MVELIQISGKQYDLEKKNSITKVFVNGFCQKRRFTLTGIHSLFRGKIEYKYSKSLRYKIHDEIYKDVATLETIILPILVMIQVLRNIQQILV